MQRHTVSAGCIAMHFIHGQCYGKCKTKVSRTTHIPETVLLARNVHVLLSGRIPRFTSWFFGKVVTRKLHLHVRLGTGIMAKEVFTEEPMDVRKLPHLCREPDLGTFLVDILLKERQRSSCSSVAHQREELGNTPTRL